MRRAALLILTAAPFLAPGTAAAQGSGHAFVFTVDGLTPEVALDDPVIGAIARSGGVGLLGSSGAPHLALRGLSPPAGGDAELTIRTVVPSDAASVVRSALEASEDDEALVIVVGTAEADMLILAQGPPRALLAGRGRAGGLTSETTRRAGVVAGADVRTTIADFLGTTGDPAGSVIRIEGPPPVELFDRALEFRRIAVPLGLVVLALGIGSLVVGVAILLLRIRTKGPRSAVAVVGLFAVALMVALIPASVLPSLEPAVLIPGLLVMGGVLTVAALAAGRGDHRRAVVVVAGAGLAILAVDAVLGWPTEVTPLLGGGAVVGVRFYGLGNSASGIVLAGSVLLAARLRPWAGAGLLAGTALFAGLPLLGSDLGGGVTLFAAAGLWYGWRVRGRLDPVTAAVTAAAGLVGAAVLVAAHALWPWATHVARAVEAGGAVGTFGHRFLSNLRETAAIWPVWLTVIGLPVWGLVAARMARPFRRMLADDLRWRLGIIVLVIGGMIGYVLNDTYGMAAVAFAFASAAMVYPTLRWTGD